MKRSLSRTLIAVVTALGTLATGTLLAAPAEAGRPADRPWSGYRTAHGKTAATPWVGSRKLNNRVVYRIDPRAARGPSGGFGAVRKISRITGPGRHVSANRVTTSRAAYILSKYGTLRRDTQSAGVDAAILHLLAGGNYRLNGRAGKQRLRLTGSPGPIRGMARLLIQESDEHAGPYVITPTQYGAAIPGGTARVRVSVTSQRSGAPLAGVRVRVFGAHGSGEGTTDESGTATAEFSAGPAGTQSYRVLATKVPEHRLRVRKPSRRAASRIAIAGAKHALRTRGTLQVTAGNPQVTVAVPNKRVRIGRSPGGTFTISGGVGGDPRDVVITRWGPSEKGSQARCSEDLAPPLRKSTSIPITGNGTYALPRWDLKAEGYYVYSVRVGANTANPEAFVCGAKVHAVQP